MKQQFFEFIESPSLETYLAIRELVLSDASYNPYSEDLNDLFDRLEAGDYVQVQQGISGGMPNLLLSPRAHMLAAIAAENTGELKGAEVERYIATACVKGILSTGDGSFESPYLVVRTSDEYDVLQFLDLQPQMQSLQSHGLKHYDVIVTTAGREICFDISDAYNALQSRVDG